MLNKNVPHITKPVKSIHAIRGHYHAWLESGQDVPVSRRQARALIACAGHVQHWSFGVYSNWIFGGPA